MGLTSYVSWCYIDKPERRCFIRGRQYFICHLLDIPPSSCVCLVKEPLLRREQTKKEGWNVNVGVLISSPYGGTAEFSVGLARPRRCLPRRMAWTRAGLSQVHQSRLGPVDVKMKDVVLLARRASAPMSNKT